MAKVEVSRELRKKYFNLCNPDEALAPADPRNVDIDELVAEARGTNVVDAIAEKLELSDTPVCAFFTGLPGSGKSTELQRLADRLGDAEGAHLLAVLIDAEDVIDLSNPIDVPDILIAILHRTDAAVLVAEGRKAEEALTEGRVTRILRWFSATDVDVKSLDANVGGKVPMLPGVPGGPEVSGGVRVVMDLKTNPSLRKRARDRIAAHMTTFIEEVRDELTDLQKRARARGHAGLVVLFDSLEKLRGISTNWTEVLASAERVFAGGAPYLKLPVHAVYTLPTALVLRLNMQPMHFLPMLKLFDKQGRAAAGFSAARKLIHKRVPRTALDAYFGGESKEHVNELIRWSGGYPREIVRLLQTLVSKPSLDEASFRRHLSMAGQQYRDVVPESAYAWLARVHVEKSLAIADDAHREMVDLMLSNNVVLRYQNDDQWVDLHPAVKEIPGVDAAIKLLVKAKAEAAARTAGGG